MFTIGPDDSHDSLMKYAKILTGRTDKGSTRQAMMTGRDHVQEIVKGIIEGETRVIVSQMTMEEIFKERQVFKTHVIESVQSELDQFGLRIYNANVKELQDAPGSEYFKVLSRKAHEGASNQAKIDVANARMLGSIGESEKVGKTKQEISKIDAETAVLETKRKSEKATADAALETTQTKLNMGVKLASIQAVREAEAKDVELQREVEKKRAQMKLEKLRATDLVQATIDKESAQETAEAQLYTETKAADAVRYKQKQSAEAQLFTDMKGAEGALIKQQQHAEGSCKCLPYTTAHPFRILCRVSSNSCILKYPSLLSNHVNLPIKQSSSSPSPASPNLITRLPHRQRIRRNTLHSPKGRRSHNRPSRRQLLCPKTRSRRSHRNDKSLRRPRRRPRRTPRPPPMVHDRKEHVRETRASKRQSSQWITAQDQCVEYGRSEFECWWCWWRRGFGQWGFEEYYAEFAAVVGYYS